MKIVLLIQTIGISLILTGCCSSSQPWGQMEGFKDITFVNNGQPFSLPSIAPRDDIYGLWQLSDKRSVGKCVYREGSDCLVLTVFLKKGEPLGFCKSNDGLNAYAGNLCVPLSWPDYSWRIEITDEDRKQYARENFWYGVTDVGYGVRFGLEALVFAFGGI